MKFETLYWDGDIDGVLVLTDQRKLPNEFVDLKCETTQNVFDAIITLATRGAPAIGVAAAYGVCVHMQTCENCDLPKAVEHLNSGADYLATSRPTAVNLFWALEKMKGVAENFLESNPHETLKQLREKLLVQAKLIEAQDKEMCAAIGDNGLQFIKPNSRILTHCNAGALATAGIGTALAPMYAAKNAGIDFKVYADETRPLLQGARLTAWELSQNEIDVTVVCDNMAGWMMKKEMIDLVIVGADRIAANGDAANKIGTYSLSILAKHHEVPFYVAAPSSTFDLSLESGELIPIEQRGSDEVACFAGVKTAPNEAKVFNPAFDVAPAENITAIITERGVIEFPTKEKIESLMK